MVVVDRRAHSQYPFHLFRIYFVPELLQYTINTASHNNSNNNNDFGTTEAVPAAAEAAVAAKQPSSNTKQIFYIARSLLCVFPTIENYPLFWVQYSIPHTHTHHLYYSRCINILYGVTSATLCVYLPNVLYIKHYAPSKGLNFIASF